jgi:hypothetical protein
VSKGFFASLFDTSFSSLITTRVVKVLYVLTLIVIGLVAVAFILSAFAQSAGAGVLTLLILAPLGALFYAVYARVILELFIAIHRLVEYNGELVSLTRQQMGLPMGGPAGPTTAPLSSAGGASAPAAPPAPASTPAAPPPASTAGAESATQPLSPPPAAPSPPSEESPPPERP